MWVVLVVELWGTLKIPKIEKQNQDFARMEFYRSTRILDRNYFCFGEQPRKTEKYVSKLKNRSYNNYDEETYSRTPDLNITPWSFEEIKKDVKKTQHLLGEITQKVKQFSEHLQKYKESVIQGIHCKEENNEQKLGSPPKVLEKEDNTIKILDAEVKIISEDKQIEIQVKEYHKLIKEEIPCGNEINKNAHIGDCETKIRT